MAITKATASSIAPAAKGDLVAGTATNDAGVLAVGANGTVLTAASGQATGLEWATPSSGGMTLLSTTTLSGASTTISSINQTYNSLYMVISGVTNATGNGTFSCNPNADATLSTYVLYNAAGFSNITADILRLTPSTGGNYSPTRTDANNAWIFTINNYASTTAQKAYNVYGSFVNVNNQQAFFTWGRIATTSAITSLVFSNSGGNFSTGTILLYGVK